MEQQPKMTFWQEITTDYKTGHTVFKDWSKAVAFVAGLVYLFVLVPSVFILCLIYRPEHEPVVLPLEIGVILLGTGVSTQVIKEVSGYYQRKTKDEDGALMKAASPPNELAPQENELGGVTG